MFYTSLDILNIFRNVKNQRQLTVMPKLNENSLSNLQNLTDRFNTKWSNINPYRYFECGLKLWKSFSYPKFLNAKVLKNYIKKDKKIKRKITGKNEIIKSFEYLKSKKITSLEFFREDNKEVISLAVCEYFSNNIDKILLYYLMVYNYIPDTMLNRRYTSYIQNNIKEMKALVKRYTRLIKKLEKEMLMSIKYDKPYIDKPKKKKDQVKDQLIYGNGETIKEKKKKKKDYKDNQLNE